MGWVVWAATHASLLRAVGGKPFTEVKDIFKEH